LLAGTCREASRYQYMLDAFQIATLLLVALAMATAVAHALELPGKMRLSKETYLAVQPMYYPGFTIVGGFGEFGGMLATLALLFVTPRDTMGFRFTLSALIALILMQGVFWIFTQPVNRFWLKDQKLHRAGAAFFRTGRRDNSNSKGDDDSRKSRDWTELRNQWEYSHVARGLLSLLAVAMLAAAIAAD
jgi:hypothetical protein